MTFLTVFHHPKDSNLLYSGEAVHVDGVRIEVRIYGDLIAAISSFKYLGVQLDSAACSPTAHSEDRLAAFDRAAHLLASGLSRIPSFPHRFLTYSWLSLVVPAMSYGLEVFAHSSAFVQKARSKELKWGGVLLIVGGGRATKRGSADLVWFDACRCFLACQAWFFF